ncbi:hypothetical protein AUJ64_01660 [Candidatus Pacearchaeota archaeon CG1_02_39_14]|nr:MAG: hypothetical protein AUJ64_01660 [Candidatus Pacearchaeota archaeon CG1_02_39_14]
MRKIMLSFNLCLPRLHIFAFEWVCIKNKKSMKNTNGKNSECVKVLCIFQLSEPINARMKEIGMSISGSTPPRPAKRT